MQKKDSLTLSELLTFLNQHDKKHVPIHPGDGPSEQPDEQFFIDVIGDDLNRTGRMLRDEEERVFSTERWSRDYHGDNCFYRDYYRLCRGIDLVSIFA